MLVYSVKRSEYFGRFMNNHYFCSVIPYGEEH